MPKIGSVCITAAAACARRPPGCRWMAAAADRWDAQRRGSLIPRGLSDHRLGSPQARARDGHERQADEEEQSRHDEGGGKSQTRLDATEHLQRVAGQTQAGRDAEDAQPSAEDVESRGPAGMNGSSVASIMSIAAIPSDRLGRFESGWPIGRKRPAATIPRVGRRTAHTTLRETPEHGSWWPAGRAAR